VAVRPATPYTEKQQRRRVRQGLWLRARRRGAREDAAAAVVAVVAAETGIRSTKELNRKKSEIVSESELNDHVHFIFSSFYYAVLESRAREYIS
jgi:hypothetical protein